MEHRVFFCLGKLAPRARNLAWVGLVFLAPLTQLSAASPGCPALTRVRFYPAEGQARRMLHGRFTGSNEGVTTGFETLAEIKEVPPEHQWTEIRLAAPVRYRFIKYEAPGGSWGNIAELEFYAGDQKIAGTPFGTTGSRDNSGRDYHKALDGDVLTFFDGQEPNNQYVGLDLGASVQAAAPVFTPPPGSYPQAQGLSVSSATPGAKIRIARGGGTPSRNQGQEFKEPLRLDKSEILAAVAYDETLAASPVVVTSYRIGQVDDGRPLTRTFHIGNSLTDTVDGWLKPLAESGGHPLDFHRFTIPGAPTDWLWEHPASGFGDSRYVEAFFAFAPFDALITQPFAGHGRSIENEAEHTGKFFELCRKQSPKVRLWLYQQWPDQTFSEGWSKGMIGLGGRKADWEKKLKLQPGESLVDGGWQGTLLKSSTPPKSWQAAVAFHSRYFELLQQELQQRFPGAQISIIPAGPGLATLKTMVETGQVPGLTDFFKEFFAEASISPARAATLFPWSTTPRFSMRVRKAKFPNSTPVLTTSRPDSSSRWLGRRSSSAGRRRRAENNSWICNGVKQ